MGDNAEAGRDKLTLVIDPLSKTLGLWIEQLIAESTGKEGKGILPVNGEVSGAPDVYGNDRLFVAISLGQFQKIRRQSSTHLLQPGILSSIAYLKDLYDLGAEFFMWEFATAVCRMATRDQSFRSPNVQEAKDATKELLDTFVRRGHLVSARRSQRMI